MRATLVAATVFAVLSTGLVAQGALQAPCFEPQFGTNLGLGDDAVALAQPLGFSFPVPGGTTTTTIGVSSNGFVWLDNSFDSGCCDGNETKFLSRASQRCGPTSIRARPARCGSTRSRPPARCRRAR
jgi:hypothetical protein